MANECLEIITEANKDRLSDDELVGLLEDLQDSKKMVSGNLGVDAIEAAMFKRGEAISNDIMLEALNKKRMALKNITLENNIVAMAREADELVDDPALGLQAAIAGVNAPISGASNSTAARSRAINDSWLGAFISDLGDAGVQVQFNSMKSGSQLELEVGRVIESLNTPESKSKLDVSADAMAIGKLIHKYQELQLNRKNQAGAYIRRRKGYAGSQQHNPRKILNQGGGKEGVKWKADHMASLDWDAMRVPAEKRQEFLDKAHEFLRRGEPIPDNITDFDFRFTGNGSIAKRLSQHRVFVYRSSDAALEMNGLYGYGTLKDGFIADTMMNARAVALLDTLGDDPKAMAERVKARLSDEFRGDDAKLDKIQDKGARVVTVDALLAEVTGDVNLGAQTTAAVVMANIRAVKTLSALGRVILSVPGDISYMAANRIYQGQSMMGSWGDAFSALFKGMEGGEKRQLAQQLGVGINGMIGDMSRGFGAPDQLDGKMSRTMSLFFKLNGLNWWTDANQRGATYMISNDLAINATKSFDKVPPSLQRVLRIYGIDAKKWEVARLAIKKLDDGNVYMMPGDVTDVKGAVFSGLSEPQQTRLKTEVRESLFTLLTNEASISVPEPGAREMAIMRRGYRPDELVGQGLRSMFQFKGFGVSVLSRVMGRQVYGTGAKTLGEALMRGNGENLGLVNAIIGMSVLGYFSMQLKETSKGRSLRPADTSTLIAAMAQGGGLGIYGDFLFGEYNRFGGGPLQTAAGPVIGTAADLVSLLQKARSGDEDVRGDTLRIVKSNIPFANLLFLKDALDYMIWYQLQEMINPGYLQRMERRVKRDNGQTYWLPPSATVKRGGGFK